MEIKKLSKKHVKQCLDIYNYYIENTTATFEEKRLTYTNTRLIYRYI